MKESSRMVILRRRMMNSSFIIREFLITGTKDIYSDMYHRSYTMAPLTSNNIDNITETILDCSAKKAGTIDAFDVSQRMNNFINLKTGVGSYIEIPNGWNQSRLRFMLIVEQMINALYSQIFVIQGFTDYPGVSSNGQYLDPSLVFHFNSVTEYTVIKTQDSLTGQIRLSYSNVNAYNLLQDKGVTGQWVPGNTGQKTLIRPMDLHTTNYIKHMSNDGFLCQPINVGTYNNHELETSTRMNNDKASYFSKVLNSYTQANDISSISDYNISYESANYSNAERKAAEPDLMRNKFFATLSEFASNSHIGNRRAYFTWSELLGVFPDLEYCKKVIPERETVNYGSIVGDVMTLNSPNVLNALMTEFTNSLTSMMISSLLTEVVFSIQYTPGFPDPIIAVTGAQTCLDNESIPQFAETFKNRLVSITMPSTFGNYPEPFTLNVHADLFNDTIINFGLLSDLNNPQTYIFPTFADSLYSNVISTEQDKQTLANNVDELLEDMDRSRQGNHSLQQQLQMY